MCAVSWAAWLLLIGVHARPGVLRMRCPRPVSSCSPVCTLGVLSCVCGVPGHLALVHRCALSVCCVACAVSWATWLPFTGVLAQCVGLRVRRPGPLGFCSPVCTLDVMCCVCGVLSDLAPGHQCARSVCCFACAMSLATCVLFKGAHAGCDVLCVWCARQLGSCSPVCLLSLRCCVCGVIGLLAFIHFSVCLVCCVACVLSWAS